jgi:hypothetical protein
MGYLIEKFFLIAPRKITNSRSFSNEFVYKLQAYHLSF